MRMRASKLAKTFFNFPLDGLLTTPYNEGSSKERAPIKGGKEKHL